MVKYCVPPQGETVLPSRTEGVLRNERYVTPVVGFFFAYHIIGKRGIRVSVVGVQAEGIGHLGTYRCFRSDAPALSRIDRDASQSVFGKAGNLLVARVHIEESRIGLQFSFG